MDLVILTLLVSAVLMARAGLARASCAVTLDGDAETVARIRSALAAFPDDTTACIAVRVRCDASSGEIAVDLQDELGRSAHRTFASPDGAAAFLISWSRRPLLDARPALVATLAVPPPDPATASALAIRAAMARHGGDGRVVAPPSTDEPRTARAVSLADDVEASAGIELGWVDRVRLRSELIAGGQYATTVARSSSTALGGQLAAIGAGLRTTVASRLASAVWVEGGASWDAAQLAKLHQDTAPFERAPADPFRNTMRLETAPPWPQ